LSNIIKEIKMENSNKILKINKNKIFISFFAGFFLANIIPQKYFTIIMTNYYDRIYSSTRIVEYDKYYKVN